MIKHTRIVFLLSGLLLISSCSIFKKGGSEDAAQKDRLDEQTRMHFEDLYFRAEREKMLNNFNEALDYYHQALQIDSMAPGIYFSMGEILAAQGQQKKAFKYLERANQLEKNNIYFAEKFGEVASNIKNYEVAAEAYKQAQRINPKNPENYFQEANQYLYLKDYKKALKVYDAMEARFGIGEELIRQKEQVYLQLNKPDKAIAEIQKLIDASPYEPRYLGLMAELYMQTGQLEKSAAMYRRMLIAEPSNGFAYFGLAEYYRQKNNRDSLIFCLNEAFRDSRIGVNDKLNVVYSLIPLIDQDPRMKKPVFELMETIRGAHPGSAQAYVVLGDLHYADGQPHIALKRYQQAIELDPNDFKVWDQVMNLQESLQDFRGLLETSEQALEYFPNQLSVYLFNANAKLVTDDLRGAIEIAGMGLALSLPEDEINAMLYAIQGDAYHKQNANAKAYAAYDRSLELYPENVYVLNNYAYYLALDGKNLDKALEMSGRTLKIAPKSPSYLDTYGWILYKQGKYIEARAYLVRAIALEPESAELLEHLGDITYKLGEKDEAAKYWKKAFELNPKSEDLKKKIDGQVNL